jgi:hypothetical protein
MANQGSKEIWVVQINCIALFTITPQNLVIIAIVGDSTASFLVGWLGQLGASLHVMPRYAAQHGTGTWGSSVRRAPRYGGGMTAGCQNSNRRAHWARQVPVFRKPL